jgi:murein tripeptide amidase MpaA
MECRASNVRGLECTFDLVNAKEASFPDAWPGTWAVQSTDRETWTRAPTTYCTETGVLSISVSALDADTVWVAYFAPYSNERHHALLAECQAARERDGTSMCTVTTIGQSVEGRDIEVVSAGVGPAQCWIVARQHPGESMAEWWADGFLKRLLDKDDAVARAVRELA